MNYYLPIIKTEKVKMPIIERVVETVQEDGSRSQIREKLAVLPDRTGVYSTEYGEVHIVLCSPARRLGEPNIRKMIISGELVESSRRVVLLHPSPKKEALQRIGSTGCLSFRSNPEHKQRM